ncbi:SRPBCC family protein [Thermomonospora catenispora]|uniref:SRPBCC family protein n=1 Tax=Thermomonospora catenispora TaxID=2493090 RepID=UPI001121071B|nr:SRPBCC family protein [Thermomonospora catenispora]TNY38163.1 polyketide cyclase [Thermomonospora catenispora]
MRYEASTVIDAPVERVWEVLIDVERWPEWSESMTRVQRQDAGPLRPGSTAKVSQPRLPTAVWRVTELTPNASFTWESTSPGVTTVAGHELTSTEDGRTGVKLTLEQTGPLVRLVSLFTGRLTRRYLEMEAQGLKARCESAGSS